MFGFNFIPNSPVKNLERMLVHVGLEYGKYVSGISPSCIILWSVKLIIYSPLSENKK
jgi:hypothetical protein